MTPRSDAKKPQEDIRDNWAAIYGMGARKGHLDDLLEITGQPMEFDVIQSFVGTCG